MAFLAQRGLPDHLTLHILELAGADSVPNVCATDRESREFIHRVQCDFPETWARIWSLDRPPLREEALIGVKSLKLEGKARETHSGEEEDMSTVQLAPTVRKLVITNMCGTSFVNQLDLRHMCPNLCSLSIENCRDLEELPPGFLPSSLQKLEIRECPSFTSLSTLPAGLLELLVCPIFVQCVLGH